MCIRDSLYGQDMNDKTNPFEAGLGWLVHLEMPVDFVGRQALEQAVESGPAKRLVGLSCRVVPSLATTTP